MAVLSAGQIYALATQAGFTPAQAVTATAIALAESKGDTDAVGDVRLQTAKWGPSIGLWQIRSLKAESGSGTTRDASKLKDPAFNAKSAYAIWKGRGGFSDWSVYGNGTNSAPYFSKLSEAMTAAKSQGFDGLASQADNASNINQAASGIASAVGVTEGESTLEGVQNLLTTVQSGQFWTRVGIGAGGVLVILLAVLVMVWSGKDKILKSTVGSVVGSTVKAVKK